MTNFKLQVIGETEDDFFKHARKEFIHISDNKFTFHNNYIDIDFEGEFTLTESTWVFKYGLDYKFKVLELNHHKVILYRNKKEIELLLVIE